jgi:hypothetical protein
MWSSTSTSSSSSSSAAAAAATSRRQQLQRLQMHTTFAAMDSVSGSLQATISAERINRFNRR